MTSVRSAVLIMTLIVPVSAQAQSAPAPPDVIKELLAEVRGLRQAMERAATVGARIQLLVARVQLQEQRISELSKRVVAVRDEMSKLDVQAIEMQRQVSHAEKAATSTAFPADERTQMAQVADDWKAKLATVDKRRQELASEESMLSQQIAADQGRWSDVNGQLDDIERSLTTPRKQ